MAEVENQKSPELVEDVKHHGAGNVSCLSKPVPTSTAEEKNRIYEAAGRTDQLFKLVAVIWCVIVVPVLVSFIVYICYNLNQTYYRDANLEGKISSGDTVEILKALKRQSNETISATYNMVVGFVIVIMLIGFGCVLYFIFLLEGSRRYEVVRTATEVADIQQEHISQLSSDRTIQKEVVSALKTKIKEHCDKDAANEQLKKNKEKEVEQLQATLRDTKAEAQKKEVEIAQLTADKNNKSEKVRRLEADVREYKLKIEEHREKDGRNKEEIKQLEKLKEETMAELVSANADLLNMQKCLEEAENREKSLKKEVTRKDQSNEKLKQNLMNQQADITTLQADLDRERGEASVQKEKIDQLKADKEKLTAAKDQLSTEKDEVIAQKDKLETEKADLTKEKSDLEEEKKKREESGCCIQ